jgi:hypothetical protein
MKRIILLTALFTSVAAQAQIGPVLRDVPSDDQVVQSVEFRGLPGVISTAHLLKMDENAGGTILITHQRPGQARYHVGAINENLDLVTEEFMAGATRLSVNASGSLKITSENESIGRNRWSRTLTVAYRNNKYVLAGFTYQDRDTLNPRAGESCDYNLITGRGVRNGRAVSLSPRVIEFAKLEEAPRLYSCDGWRQ